VAEIDNVIYVVFEWSSSIHTFTANTLSLTSQRLLVTSWDPHTAPDSDIGWTTTYYM